MTFDCVSDVVGCKNITWAITSMKYHNTGAKESVDFKPKLDFNR